MKRAVIPHASQASRSARSVSLVRSALRSVRAIACGRTEGEATVEDALTHYLSTDRGSEETWAASPIVDCPIPYPEFRLVQDPHAL
jgi:hypothetical protein